MKKQAIIFVLLSIMCVLTGCTSTSNVAPPTTTPTPVVTVQPTEPPVSELTVHSIDVKVYRTDLQGDIIMKSDGDNITVTTAKNENIQMNETAAEYDEGTYIGNKNSKKFHRPDCYTLPAEKNRVEFTNRTDAVNAGYSPCGNCCP